MRTTIRLDDELLAAAKQRAAESGRTLTSVIADALRRELATPPAGSAERQPVELPSFGGEGLQPGVDLDDTAGLVELMEADAGPS
jgi:hypothetical protein